MRGNSKMAIEPVRGRHSESTIDRCTLTLCPRSTAKRAKPNRLKTQVKTYLQKYPWPTFNLIFMCSVIVLGNTRFLLFPTFLVLHNKMFLVDLKRRSKTHLEICIGTTIFLTLIYLCILLCYLL